MFNLKSTCRHISFIKPHDINSFCRIHNIFETELVYVGYRCNLAKFLTKKRLIFILLSYESLIFSKITNLHN